jgi:hypothetical protein
MRVHHLLGEVSHLGPLLVLANLADDKATVHNLDIHVRIDSHPKQIKDRPIDGESNAVAELLECLSKRQGYYPRGYIDNNPCRNVLKTCCVGDKTLVSLG